MLVGGELRAARSGDTIDANNPATGEVIGRFPRGDAADVDDAVAAAQARSGPGGPHHRSSAPRACTARRADRGARRGARHARRRPTTAARSARCATTPTSPRPAALLRRARARSCAARRSRRRTGRLNYTLRQPFGVVGRIVPFNHPLMFAASKIAAPLIAGNTVVLKPSEHTSMSALRLGELAAESLPAGRGQRRHRLRRRGGRRARHPSRRAPARLHRLGRDRPRDPGARGQRTWSRRSRSSSAARTRSSCSPTPTSSARVDGALRGMNFTWQGQSCGSTSRLLVHRSLHERVRRAPRRSGWSAHARRAARRGGHRDRRDRPPQRSTRRCSATSTLGREEGAALVTGGGPPEDPDLAGGPVHRARRSSTTSRRTRAWRRRRSSARCSRRCPSRLRRGAARSPTASPRAHRERLHARPGDRTPLRPRRRGRLRLGQRHLEALPRHAVRRRQGLRRRPRGGHRGAPLLHPDQERQHPFRRTGPELSGVRIAVDMEECDPPDPAQISLDGYHGSF